MRPNQWRSAAVVLSVLIGLGILMAGSVNQSMADGSDPKVTASSAVRRLLGLQSDKNFVARTFSDPTFRTVTFFGAPFSDAEIRTMSSDDEIGSAVEGVSNEFASDSSFGGASYSPSTHRLTVNVVGGAWQTATTFGGVLGYRGVINVVSVETTFSDLKRTADEVTKSWDQTLTEQSDQFRFVQT